jgi:hypothetical protein
MSPHPDLAWVVPIRTQRGEAVGRSLGSAAFALQEWSRNDKKINLERQAPGSIEATAYAQAAISRTQKAAEKG